MAIAFISAEGVSIASGANPASDNLTIPANATLVLVGYCWWNGTTGSGIDSVTLNSVSPQWGDDTTPGVEEVQSNTPTNEGPCAGVFGWTNPSTGTQALDFAWTSAPAEGPCCIAAYFSGADLSDWEDRESGHQGDGSTVETVTMTTTASTSLVVKWDCLWDDGGKTYPSLTSGWTNATTHTNNAAGDTRYMRCSYITPSGSTQACATEDPNWSGISGVSIAEGAVAPFQPYFPEKMPHWIRR